MTARSDFMALADRLSGHLGPFGFLTKDEKDIALDALRLAASQPSPPHHDQCDYCKEHGFQHPNLCEDCRTASTPDREAVKASIRKLTTLIREYDVTNSDWAFRSGVMLTEVAKILSLLSGAGTKSDGGVEVRHAATGNKPGSVPGVEMSSPATSFERVTEQEAAIQPCAGVTPGPSDPAPGPDVREALNEVITNGEWTEGEQCGEWKISKVVYDLAVEARDAALSRPVGDVQKKLNSDGQHQTEQSSQAPSPTGGEG